MSCKLRKYKNSKLNCSDGKLRKYRIGNFLMQEQQESPNKITKNNITETVRKGKVGETEA